MARRGVMGACGMGAVRRRLTRIDWERSGAAGSAAWARTRSARWLGVEGTGSIHTKNGPAAALGSRTRLGGWEQQRRSGGDEESRGLEGGVQGRRACVRG